MIFSGHHSGEYFCCCWFMNYTLEENMNNEKLLRLIFEHFDNTAVMSREDFDNLQLESGG